MRKRTGDWRDLLSAYALALDAKKIYVGFIATIVTVIIMVVVSWLYSLHFGGAGYDFLPPATRGLVDLGELSGEDAILWHFLGGTGLAMVGAFLPLLNPFHGGFVHLVLSSLLYVGLFAVWSGAGGVISRLAALEYARDDLPTLGEARAMVRSRRKAYFFAPLMPFIAILFLAACNIVGGVVASAWYIGRILLILGFPLLVASTITIVFLAVLGILSFGLMMPAISVGGKDAFESWSTAYSYVLWGLRRFVCYTVLAGVVGAVAAVVAWGLTELVIYCVHQTVNIGFLSGRAWMMYEPGLGGRLSIALLPAQGGFAGVLSGVVVALMLVLRAIPAAYVFSYFFTANTIIFFLMRKDQDNIEIDEVYEEEEEEGEAAGVEEAPAEEEEAPAEEEAAPEQEAEESAPEEEEAGEKEETEEQQEPEEQEEGEES